MSFEIEVKYRSVDHDRLGRLLADLGATPISDEEQEDSYFNHPARDFAQTNEAFRIRRIGSENHITYKGPRRPGPTKTREEIEIGFSDGQETFEQLSRLFANLGFRPVATVRKRRRSYKLVHQGIDVTIGLDGVEGLGEFAEVEVVASKDEEIAAAQRAILSLAESLGLTEVEPRSYLRMILEQRAGTSGK